MTCVTRFSSVVLGACVGVALAGTAMAQDLRDPRTGKVWNPVLVQDGSAAANSGSQVSCACDLPLQDEIVSGVVTQHARAASMGTLPHLGGKSLSFVEVDVPSLQAAPTKDWLAVLYVTNNSRKTVNVVLDCSFIGAGQKIESARVAVPPAAPGERLGFSVRGPQTNLAVDRVTCGVVKSS